MEYKKLFIGIILFLWVLESGCLYKMKSQSLQSYLASDKVSLDFSGDVVSSYVWRGIKQTGISVQPSLNLKLSDFTIGAWGSTDFKSESDKGFKEVDFSASYTINRLVLAATDYWWDGEGARHYFDNPESGKSGHMLDASLTYTLTEKIPLSFNWNTFLLGKGNKKTNGDNSFSTFIELSYPFSFKGYNLSLATGFTPWESVIYSTRGFEFTEIKLGIEKEIKITDSFTLPIFGNIIANPSSEDMHFIFGIRIK